MRNSSILTLVAAIFLGLIAVAVMNRKLSDKPQVIPMAEVLVAKRDLARGASLTKDDLESKSVPKEILVSDSIDDVELALERMLLFPLVKGEMIQESRLGPKGQTGLAVQIQEGMRAFTIETPKLSNGVGGMIQPGNKVDVILTITENNRSNDSDFTGGGSSSILLQNVEVLAVDRRIDTPQESNTRSNSKDTKDTKSVTLLVSPEQSALLTLGQTKGTLFLSLRHPNDEILADTRPYTFREIQSLKTDGDSFSSRVGTIFRALVSSRNSEEPVQSEQKVETVEKTTQQEPKVTKKTSLHNNHIRIVRGQSEDLVIIRNLEQ